MRTVLNGPGKSTPLVPTTFKQIILFIVYYLLLFIDPLVICANSTAPCCCYVVYMRREWKMYPLLPRTSFPFHILHLKLMFCMHMERYTEHWKTSSAHPYGLTRMGARTATPGTAGNVTSLYLVCCQQSNKQTKRYFSRMSTSTLN